MFEWSERIVLLQGIVYPGKLKLVISNLFTRQHVLLILYWFFERAHSVLSTALKKDVLFSVLNVFLCFNGSRRNP